MRKVIILVTAMVLLSGCGYLDFSNDTEAKKSVQQVATNLQIPWSINKHGEEFFISERVGTIARVASNGKVTHQQVKLSSPLAKVSEAGLLGFVLKPNFEETKEAFAYYTYDVEGLPYNRVVTLKLEGNKWTETAILLDGILTGNVHHGGRLEIGPDQLLYVTIGDASNPNLAQDPTSKNGKIMRLNEDNTWSVVSMGHRNPQGIAWNENGEMFASEHGQSAKDEINRIEEGKNYGWPLIEGNEQREGLVSPLLHSGSNTTWAPSGMTFHKGKLYVAALRGEGVLVVNNETAEIEETITGYGRIRDVFSDGEHLYFVSNNTDGRGSPSADDDILYRYVKE